MSGKKACQNKNKVCAVIFAAAALLLAALLAYALTGALAANDAPVVENGRFSASGETTPDTDYALNGLWEFYPDALICSGGAAGTEPGYIAVPSNWSALPAELRPRTGAASYRLVVDELQLLGRNNINLVLFSLLSDCRVFINGEEQGLRMRMPWAYQLYPVNAEGTVEIVVEMSRSATGLNVTPHLSFIGVQMERMDPLRNLVLVLGTLFLIIFVMFFVFSFSPNAKRLRPFSLLGICCTLLFWCNTFWISGYLDLFEGWISGAFWPVVILGLEALTLSLGIWQYRREWPELLSRRFMAIAAGLPALAWLSELILVYALHIYSASFLAPALMLLTLVFWAVKAGSALKRGRSETTPFSLTLLCLGAALLSNRLYWFLSRLSWLQLMLPAGVVLYMFFCFYQYNLYQQTQLRRAQEMLALEKQTTKMQSALLTSQIHPHFLFNTLQTIQELCYKEPESASRLITRFSEYLRQNIDFMNYTELIPFSTEEKHIRNYIGIQQARFGEALRFEADIRFREFQIPPLAVQPIVENAVKYGVRKSESGGEVRLEVFQDGDGVHILVRNTGPGFDTEAIPAGHSLDNIRSRLRTLLHATLTITSDSGAAGAAAEILIPAREVRT